MIGIMSEEEFKTLSKNVTVEKAAATGMNLEITLTSAERSTLDRYGRAFVSTFLKSSSDYQAFANAGMNGQDCIVAYDPKNPEADTTKLIKQALAAGKPQPTFHYSQTYRLTRKPI